MMRLFDRVGHRLRGELAYEVWRGRDGDEQLVEAVIGENLILTNAQVAIMQALGGTPSKQITQFGIGTSGVPPTIANTALTGAVLVATTGVSYPSATSVAFAWNVARGVATGMAIQEFGLFTADSVLVARKVRAGAIVKGADIRIAGTWTLHF